MMAILRFFAHYAEAYKKDALDDARIWQLFHEWRDQNEKAEVHTAGRQEQERSCVCEREMAKGCDED